MCSLVWHRCLTAVVSFPLPCSAQQLFPSRPSRWGKHLGKLRSHFRWVYILLRCFGSWFCSWPVPWLQSRAGSADLLVGVGARPQWDDPECPRCSSIRAQSTRDSIYCMPRCGCTRFQSGIQSTWFTPDKPWSGESPDTFSTSWDCSQALVLCLQVVR